MLPSVISADTPDTNGMNWLAVQNGERLRIDQLERAFIEIHKQVFSLEKCKICLCVVFFSI